MSRVGIVGAGLGGLSAAVRLAHSGYQVDVYDQQPITGGKAGVLNLEGYRFDTGPSLLTMPAAISRQFTHNIRQLIFLSIGTGIALTVAGLWCSYALDLASGPTIILVLGAAVFLISFLRRFKSTPKPSDGQ